MLYGPQDCCDPTIPEDVAVKIFLKRCATQERRERMMRHEQSQKDEKMALYMEQGLSYEEAKQRLIHSQQEEFRRQDKEFRRQDKEFRRQKKELRRQEKVLQLQKNELLRQQIEVWMQEEEFLRQQIEFWRQNEEQRENQVEMDAMLTWQLANNQYM